MASDGRSPPRALSRLLGALPTLGFYTALRQIECDHRAHPLIGEALSPTDEPVRFGQDASLAFRAQSIVAIEDAHEQTPARLTVGFFGMSGPQGPLPTHLTEYVRQRRVHAGDHTLSRFLDIFHHRFVSLLYRAWASVQPTVQQDRPTCDRYARQLGALTGHHAPANAHATDALTQTRLYTARHFTNFTRQAEGLTKVLAAHFGVAVAIEEFVGEWLTIPDAYRWRLPSGREQPVRAPSVLGESTRLGAEVWDVQAKFRVVLGPLAREAYERFLPGSPDLAQLSALVSAYAGPELAWDVRLVLAEPDRSPAVLGVAGAIGRTAHLGGGAESASDASMPFEDLVLDPRAHVA